MYNFILVILFVRCYIRIKPSIKNMTDSAYELFYKNSQQYSPNNENLTIDESIKSNSL